VKSSFRYFGKRRLLPGLLATLLALPAWAQNAVTLPDRPIRMVMTGSAGGGTDAPSRLIAGLIQEAVGRTVVVEPMPSGGGVVAVQTVARARPDGMTILSATSAIVTLPHLEPNTPYRALRDLVPLSQLNAGANILITNLAVPARTVAEFTAWVKQQPDGVPVGNYGYGSSAHQFAALFGGQAGLNLTHVPMRTGLLQNVLGGHVCCAFIDTSSASSQLRTGNIRILAASGPRRLAALPDVPAFSELGFRNFEPVIWQGFFLPQGTPPEIVQLLGRAIHEGVKRPEVTQRIRDWGFEPVGSLPEDFLTVVRREDQVWAEVSHATGIRAQ
jgi:tripartite-type tricarboxylate transporter receptor subunit TctC